MDDQSRKDLAMLKAELSLVRSNLKRTERENEALRDEKSRQALDQYNLEAELRRKIGLQLRDDQLMGNQRKMLRASEAGAPEAPSAKFVLQSVMDDPRLNPEDRLYRLQFFRDYFFDDFYLIPDRKAVEVVEGYSQMPGHFVAAYALLSCKKAVFERFAGAVFESNAQLPVKIEILENVPVEWTLELGGELREFVQTNRRQLHRYMANVAEKCPMHLSRVLGREEFDWLLERCTGAGERIVRRVAEEGIKGFIDERNVHLVGKEYLKVMFGDDYVDIIS